MLIFGLPNHAKWDISLLILSKRLQRLTFDGNCVEQLYSINVPLIKAFTTIISKHVVDPCVMFSDEGSCLKFIKMRATPFLIFSC